MKHIIVIIKEIAKEIKNFRRQAKRDKEIVSLIETNTKMVLERMYELVLEGKESQEEFDKLNNMSMDEFMNWSKGKK